MIKIISTLFLSLILTIGCDKSSKVDQALADDLFGKWVYTEYYVSPGTETDWKPADPAGQTIEFKKNGAFINDINLMAGFNKFEIIDSTTVRFKKSSDSGDFWEVRVKINVKDGMLELWGKNCIEGCGYRFRRS